MPPVFQPIILALIVLFPLAFLLLMIRFLLHFNDTYLKIRDLRQFAILNIGFSATLILFMALFEIDMLGHIISVISLFFFFLVLSIPGFLGLAFASTMNGSLQRRYERYRDLILNQGIHSIPAISGLIGKNVPTTLNDLRRMIHLGLLPSVRIDETTQHVLVDNVSNQPQEPSTERWNVSIHINETASASAYRQTEPAKTKTTECFACGAKMQLKLKESRLCEYCGSTVTGA